MADDSSESRAYTEGDRERWDLPYYGLPKSLPTKLGDVIVVLLHALRFALFLGMGGLVSTISQSLLVWHAMTITPTSCKVSSTILVTLERRTP